MRKIKYILLFILFVLFFFDATSILAQDIIVKKNGDEIKAKIIEVGTTEIKYKKFENLQTSPIYSIYKSDVFMIKYADGSKDVFNNETPNQQPQQQAPPQQQQQAPPPQNNTVNSKGSKLFNKQNSSQGQHYSMGQKKIILGTGFSLLNTYKVGNLNDFFEYTTGDPTRPCDAGSPVLMNFNFGFRNCMDTTGNNWLGIDLQFVVTAHHAIWGSEVQLGGGSDVFFNGFFMNVPITYLHAIDQKKHLFVAIEPALDMALIDGSINIPSPKNGVDTTYTEAMSFGFGYHIAAGIDYYLGKFLGLNARIGYRHLKTPEIHYNDKSSTGFSAFYANGVSGETVKVDWSGVYFTIGAYLALDKKSKSKY